MIQRSKTSRRSAATGTPGTWWISERYGTPVARESFAAKDWARLRADNVARLKLYKASVDAAEMRIRVLLGEGSCHGTGQHRDDRLDLVNNLAVESFRTIGQGDHADGSVFGTQRNSGE